MPELPLHKKSYCQVGTVHKTYGVAGGLVIALEPTSNWMATEETVFVQFHATYVPFRIQYLWKRPGKVCVLLQNVSDPSQAQSLVGKSVYVHSLSRGLQSLSSPVDAVGCLVEDVRLGNLGTVQAVHSFPQQFLLSLQHRGQEILIPYHMDIVKKVDRAARRIEVDLPLGLVEEAQLCQDYP